MNFIRRLKINLGQIIERTLQGTLVWPILKPREIYVFGIGAPKTGTLSTAKLFSRFRSGHEEGARQAISVIKAMRAGNISKREVRNFLQERNRTRRLECDVAHFLVHFCEDLVEMFPGAKFICTVRDPFSWLESHVEHTADRPRDEMTGKQKLWLDLRDINYGKPPETYPPEEQILEEYQIPSIEGYLSYWSFHYRTVLSSIPSERLLMIRVEQISHSADQISEFLDISEEKLRTNKARANVNSDKKGLLKAMDRDYVHEKIQSNCQSVLDTINKQTNVKLQRGL